MVWSSVKHRNAFRQKKFYEIDAQKCKWKRQPQLWAHFCSQNLSYLLKCKCFEHCQLLLPLFSSNRQTMIVVLSMSKKMRYFHLKMTKLENLQANTQVFQKSTQYRVSSQYISFLPPRTKMALALSIFEIDL